MRATPRWRRTCGDDTGLRQRPQDRTRSSRRPAPELARPSARPPSSPLHCEPGTHKRRLRTHPADALLTSSHMPCMVRCMKTTLNIDGTVMARLRQEATRQQRTMSEIVEAALRLFFKNTRERRALPDLPAFDSGGALVDISNRTALYDAMEGR